MARGLKPDVLLLDEPAAGVPSLESHRILRVLDNLPKHIAILIIEHDMDLVFRFAQRITVLVQGEVLVEGPPEEIARDRRVDPALSLSPQHRWAAPPPPSSPAPPRARAVREETP